MKIRLFSGYQYFLRENSELYLSHRNYTGVVTMQKISKVGVDLFFCLIIGFLIVQASNSAPQNQELTNTLSHESARISAEQLK